MKLNFRIMAVAVVIAAGLGCMRSAHANAAVSQPDYGSTSHPAYLGVGLHDVSEERAAALHLKDARGVEVIAIDHDGPAAKVGFREHDVILQMNGQDIASEEQLRRIMRETPGGRKANFLLSRDGQELKVDVVLGERGRMQQVEMPDLSDLNEQLANVSNMVNLGRLDLPNVEITDLPAISSQGLAGARVETAGPQLAKFFGSKDGAGLLVKEVREDSAAAKAGMKAGDLIVRVGDKPATDRGIWEHALMQNRGKQVTVDVIREKHEQRLTLAVAARTSGALEPDSVDAEPGVLDALLSDVERAQGQAAMEQARASMNAHHDEIEMAMAEAKRALESPEVKKAMQEGIQQARAEVQANRVQVEAAMAEAKRQMDSPAAKAAMRKAMEQVSEQMEQLRGNWQPMD